MLLSRLIGLVCEKRTQVVSSSVDKSPTSGTGGVSDMTTHALMILNDINEKYPLEMKDNGLQLMVSDMILSSSLMNLNVLFSFQRILDLVEDLTLSQFRLIMDILCSLAYTDPPCDLLKHHLDMMVKKQVSSSYKR